MSLTWDAGIRDLLVLERHELDGIVMSRNGIAASWKMAVILDAWLEVAEARESAEDGARFLLLFGAALGVCGAAIFDIRYMTAM